MLLSTDDSAALPEIRLEPTAEATVVAVRGEIDLTSKEQFHLALTSAVEASDAVLVDLCACTFMDSSGLNVLIDVRRHAAARGARVALACLPDEPPAALLDLAVPGVFAVHPDRGTGLAALSAAP